MTTTADELREEVRRRYAESARAVIEGTGGCGCGNGACCSDDQVVAEVKFGELLYVAERRGELPDAAVAVAELNKRETVLDLGSGDGIDVILSAKRVGPAGRAYGLDMTDQMLSLAEQNRQLFRLHRGGAVEERVCRGTRGRRLRGDLGRVHAPGRRRHAQRDREGRPVIQLVRPHPVRE